MVSLILGAASSLSGDRRADRALQFSARVTLVEVYATVTDAQGVVKGLTREDFSVFEDGSPQSISAFSAGSIPLAVAIGIDRSFSMSRERLAQAVAAAREFIRALKSDDRVMVLAIGSDAEVVAPLSADHTEALAALSRIEPWGTTPLYDSALGAIEAIQSASGRRALILLSDGDDRYSQASATEVVEQARRKDVLIYPIAIGRTRPPVFAELASVTGGRSFFADKSTTMLDAMRMIAQELREQYLLGYSPSRPPDAPARWRSISVRVNRPGVRIRARDGYLSQ